MATGLVPPVHTRYLEADLHSPASRLQLAPAGRPQRIKLQLIFLGCKAAPLNVSAVAPMVESVIYLSPIDVR